MFTEMISSLEKNRYPDLTALRGKLHIGLIKKEAVLRLPKNFRVSDPKINPRSDHMIWASVLLEDQDLFDLTSALFLTDLSMNKGNHPSKTETNESLIHETLERLLKTTEHQALIDKLRSNIQRLTHLI